jgi:hypothetical protein
MKTQALATGLVFVALAAFALPGCASAPGSAEEFSAHQYKYVPTTGESNTSTSSPIVGKSRMEVRTREEAVAVYRRPDPPPPRPPSDVGRPRPPKPSK